MLREYRREWLPKDVVVGLVLTTLLVPQGMAYAELRVPGHHRAVHVDPMSGGYAIFGPSKILVSARLSLGPMIAATILPLIAANGDPARAVALASMLALIVGVIMVVGGMARLGFVADLLSKPTMIGYMNGLAITILVGQLPKLFGFSTDANGLVDETRAFVDGVQDGETVRAALAVGVLALVVMAVLRRTLPRVPNVLVAVVVSISVAAGFGLEQHGVKLVGTLPEVSAADGPGCAPLRPAPAGGGALGSHSYRWPTPSRRHRRAPAGRVRRSTATGRWSIGVANLGAGFFQGFPVSTSRARPWRSRPVQRRR
jgi:MFS superfamily sulfate permease-like transporter